MYSFGSGILIGQRIDIANSTPVNFGLIQDVTIDETASLKELYGPYQRAIAIARGTIKTTGKAKAARISGLAIANLYFGVPALAGQTASAFGELATIPAMAPYTVTAANAVTFVADAGVFYSSCTNARVGQPLQLVASAPAAGQYSVSSSGVYTFAAADTGTQVMINYTYTIATAGQSFTVTNQLSGYTPTFAAKFYTSFGNKPVSVQFNSCVSSKLAFGTKSDDFVMPEFDFSVQADACGNVMTWSFGEVS